MLSPFAGPSNFFWKYFTQNLYQHVSYREKLYKLKRFWKSKDEHVWREFSINP